MKAIFLAILFIDSIALTISSCKKENQAPVVTIKEPSDNDTLTIADTLRLKGIITDDAGLHLMNILIADSTGDTTWQDSPYVHDLKVYNFNYLFDSVPAGTYTIQVSAEDHDSKTTTATRHIVVN